MIERAPPLTWKGIAADAVLAAIAFGLVFIVLAEPWRLVCFGLFLLGIFQTLRGLARKAWLALGGTDRPIKTFIERRLNL